MKQSATLFPMPPKAPVPAAGQTWGQLVAALIMAAKVEHVKRGQPFTVREVGQIIDAADQARPDKRRRVNNRDPLFDAIATACGIDLAQPLTRGQAKTIATAKRDILEVSPDVTPDEIARRAREYVAAYRGVRCTPMGIAAHWAEFPPPRRARADNGPKGWLARLNERFPACVYARGQSFEITHESPYEWSRLPKELQEGIA